MKVLTDDAKAVVALTTRLGSANRRSLTPLAWHRLSTVLQDSGIRPGSVFDLKGSIADIPGVEDPERVEDLLGDAPAALLEADDLQRRGIWTVTVEDDAYPGQLVSKLGREAPPVVFGAGDIGLLAGPGIGIVGSRNVEVAGKDAAQSLAREAVRLGFSVVSGGARGVDQISMNAAYGADGVVIGVLADSLLSRLRKPDVLGALDHGNTCLIVQQAPSSGFSPGAAMSRNKVVYGLSEATVVVAADEQSGGTWAGAAEALKKEYTRVLVWRGEGEGPGNAALERLGAQPIMNISDLSDTLRESAEVVEQMSLLDDRT